MYHQFDLRGNITRGEFAAVALYLYAAMSGICYFSVPYIFRAITRACSQVVLPFGASLLPAKPLSMPCADRKDTAS